MPSISPDPGDLAQRDPRAQARLHTGVGMWRLVGALVGAFVGCAPSFDDSIEATSVSAGDTLAVPGSGAVAVFLSTP